SGPSPSSSAGARPWEDAEFACERPRGWAVAGTGWRAARTVMTAATRRLKRFMAPDQSSRHATRKAFVYLGIHQASSAGLDYLRLRPAPPPPIAAGPPVP